MFYHLEGTVAEFGQNLVVLDCVGIGFALYTTVHTMSQLRTGEKAKLYIAESIGESNFDLYGFADKSEKNCFEMLVSVSGIGPKAALSILSYNTPAGLAFAVMNNDVKALTVAPGIGKKIAQRVILELKDKIGKDLEPTDSVLPLTPTPAAENSNLSDAVAALTMLGYSSTEISPVLKSMDTASMSAEQIIRSVLKQMVR